MKILVTGSAGFIGSHVVHTLREAGHEVTTFDLLEQPGCETHVQGSLTNFSDISTAVRKVDYVCHLGGIGDAHLAFEKPGLAAASNVVGTAHVMEAARQGMIKKVVYASTWEVYGTPRYQPIDEDHPTAPDHPYSITKLAGEQIVLSYDRYKDVPSISLRLGTAYGSGMRSTAVISSFIGKARTENRIIIEGDGTQSRQFTHVLDISRAFLLALESDVRGQEVNIVASQSCSIRTLAAMVAEQFHCEIGYAPARLADVSSAYISSEKAARVLGWRADIPLPEGLRMLIDSRDLDPQYRNPCLNDF